MQTQKEITVGQIWEEVDPRLIRKVRVVEVASLIFWIVAVLVLVALGFPYVVPFFY